MQRKSLAPGVYQIRTRCAEEMQCPLRMQGVLRGAACAREGYAPIVDDKELSAVLAGIRSRGEVKRLGARVDRDPALRGALVRRLAKTGVDSATLTGKQLVRRALDRSGAAQVRGNPIRVDESFTCVHCHDAVSPGGARVRDHCPRCLRSVHVDIVPGDRANSCGGVLDPVSFMLEAGEVTIHYRCRRCASPHRCRAHPEDAVPPSLSVADLP